MISVRDQLQQALNRISRAQGEPLSQRIDRLVNRKNNHSRCTHSTRSRQSSSLSSIIPARFHKNVLYAGTRLIGDERCQVLVKSEEGFWVLVIGRQKKRLEVRLPLDKAQLLISRHFKGDVRLLIFSLGFRGDQICLTETDKADRLVERALFRTENSD